MISNTFYYFPHKFDKSTRQKYNFSQLPHQFFSSRRQLGKICDYIVSLHKLTVYRGRSGTAWDVYLFRLVLLIVNHENTQAGEERLEHFSY